MADHPFHGKWSSYGVNSQNVVFLDGDIEFDIRPNGTFVKGHHKPRLGGGGLGDPVNLKRLSLSSSEIHVEEESSQLCRYRGKVVQDPHHPQHPNRKLIIGEYTIPRDDFENPPGSEARRPSDVSPLRQDNGTWVATQP
jgi:hypothetical protein